MWYLTDQVELATWRKLNSAATGYTWPPGAEPVLMTTITRASPAENEPGVRCGRGVNRWPARVRMLVIACLFLSAAAIRLYHINDLPSKFYITRNYLGVLPAREYFLYKPPAAPEWRREVASLNREH